MHLISCLITYILAIFPVLGAGNSTVPSAIASLPNCALTCLVSNLSNSSCFANDIACQCSDTVLKTQVNSCVVGSCTIVQALTTKNITSNLCGIQPRDRSHIIGVLGATGGALAITAVMLRCISRLKSLGGGFWWDDWAIIFAAVLIVPFTAMSSIASIGRLGKDIWAIPLEDIVIFFHQFYFAEVLYAAIMPITKTSILFFYLRIFSDPAFRRATWCLIAVSALSAITFVCVNAFQCRPIYHFWKQWDGEPGRCIGPSGPAWSVSAIGIIIDFLMLSLPIYEIRDLNLHWRKKLNAGLMFGVGFFVTIVSIVRLQSLVHFRNTTNPTYDYYSIGYWSIVEVNLGVICACMPSIRVLLTYIFSRLIGNSHEHLSDHRTGQAPTGLRSNQDVSGGMHYTRSYSNEYGNNIDQDGLKCVQLVNMVDASSSSGEGSILGRFGRSTP
ncbi:hypothetical protein BGZ60DRAFT_373634 [Tricladium varicosporioides]|nr:hypothetical protein BGZ60DRAFT_373634 [Hymenoscyphus varicosporioides]